MDSVIWVTLVGMTISAHAFRTLTCAPIALLLGCGGEVATAGSAAPVAESDFAASFKQAMCDLMKKCCSAGFDAETACSSRDYSLGTYTYRKYDPARAGACIATLRSFVSTCTIAEDVPECKGLSVGTQAIGAPCQISEDCAGFADRSAFCTSAASGDLLCQSTAKSGEFCNGYVSNAGILVFAECGTGLYCAASGLCTPQGGLGQACDSFYSSVSCAPSLRCDGATAKCANKSPVGASCMGDSDCSDHNCLNETCQGPLAVVASDLCSVNSETPLPSEEADAGI